MAGQPPACGAVGPSGKRRSNQVRIAGCRVSTIGENVRDGYDTKEGMMTTHPTNAPGVELSCTNSECSCRLRIVVPCPHGEVYKCACGHDFEPTHEGSIPDVVV
jgi:hypothetical protein